MTENLKDRIDIVIAGIHQRIPGGGTWPVHEALAELRRLAGVAWEEGFQAGRDGALRPPNPITGAEDDAARWPWAPRVWRCPRCNATIGTTLERESEAVAEHTLTCAGKLERVR